MRCRSCRAEIVWAHTVAGKRMPMERAADGTWIIVEGVAMLAGPNDTGTRYKSHFVSCPQGDQWRQR